MECKILEDKTKVSDCCGAELIDEYGKTYRCNKCKCRCKGIKKSED